MEVFEKLFEEYMRELCEVNPDPSHDILHVKRVVSLAKKLGIEEGAKLDVIVPAAYLHDCVYISKTDERRSKASQLSADKAVSLLKDWGYPNQYHLEIHHAICAHSFSANISVKTLEAQIVQDADRLDAMGAIGILRCFAFGGLSKRSLYFVEDPFCNQRTPDDQTNTLDHFYVKLLQLHSKLNTTSAKTEGFKRLATMNDFLDTLRSELEY